LIIYSIEESLSSYFGEEYMDGDNCYECSGCRQRSNAIRKTDIKEYPIILSLQLRRNVYDKNTYQKIKLKVYKYYHYLFYNLYVILSC
jgi:uncharacterized UBP type Zn finger protein